MINKKDHVHCADIKNPYQHDHRADSQCHIFHFLRKIFDTGYPHDGRADKDSYPYDGRADKDSYPHDRHNQYIMLSL